MLRPVLIAFAVLLTAGCSTLLSPEPTPVPGAAATLTRSIRTPIPTPERIGSPSPAISPVPSRVAANASPSTVAGRAPTSSDDTARVQRSFEQAFGDPRLPGVEELLLDHISLSTPQGGSVLTNAQAASWLRDRATTGLSVARTDSSTQSVTTQVVIEGWPNQDPIEHGRVTFTLRRYDQSGKPDEENGEWKVDVIDAE